MLRALSEFHVEGVPTTIPIHRWILESRSSAPATHTTTWLERALAEVDLPVAGRTCNRRPSGRTPRDRPTSWSRSTGAASRSRIFDERRTTAPDRPASARITASTCTARSARPMQGTILKVLVEKGQEIRAGEVVCILEAMKMENHIASTRDGEVTELPIRAGQVVETGQILAVID